MSRLLDIKERAYSVEKIKKITGALEVVAITRLRRQQKATLETRPYSERIQRVVSDVSENIAHKEHPLLVERKKIEKMGIITITGDKGLCGGFNNTVIAKTENFCNGKKNLKAGLITIGRKGYTFFTSRGWKIDNYIFGLSRKNEVLKIDIYQLADRLIESFLNAELDEVYIIYNSFKLQLLGEVKISRLLPVNLEDVKKKKINPVRNGISNGIKRDYVYEPEAYEVFDKLLREYLRNEIFHALVESKTSEEMARMIAMKQATDSAGELIEDLMLKFHKERQRTITHELIDIVNATDTD